MGRLEDRIRRLEERPGLRKAKPRHEWGVPPEEINRKFVLRIVLKRTLEIAEEQGEPAQGLRKLRDYYACLSAEEQGMRHNEFEDKMARLAPRPKGAA